MRIVIELDDSDQSEAGLRRMLTDANRRQETEPLDHWIEVSTPFICLPVTRVVGVVTTDTVITKLEGL